MFRTISQEIEVNVPASQAWELYGTLQLAKLAAEQPNSVIDRVEVVQGDGKVGSWNHPQHSFFYQAHVVLAHTRRSLPRMMMRNE